MMSTSDAAILIQMLNEYQRNDSTSAIAMAAAVFSAIAAVSSCVLIIVQIRRDNEFKKQDNLNEVINNLISQRQHYYTTLEALYRWDRNKDKDYWEYLFKGVLRAYLNSYEYACTMYLGNKIDKTLFEGMFKNEIIAIYEKDIGVNFELSVREENNVDKRIYCDLRKVARNFGAQEMPKENTMSKK